MNEKRIIFKDEKSEKLTLNNSIKKLVQLNKVISKFSGQVHENCYSLQILKERYENELTNIFSDYAGMMNPILNELNFCRTQIEKEIKEQYENNNAETLRKCRNILESKRSDIIEFQSIIDRKIEIFYSQINEMMSQLNSALMILTDNSFWNANDRILQLIKLKRTYESEMELHKTESQKKIDDFILNDKKLLEKIEEDHNIEIKNLKVKYSNQNVDPQLMALFFETKNHLITLKQQINNMKNDFQIIQKNQKIFIQQYRKEYDIFKKDYYESYQNFLGRVDAFQKDIKELDNNDILRNLKQDMQNQEINFYNERKNLTEKLTAKKIEFQEIYDKNEQLLAQISQQTNEAFEELKKQYNNEENQLKKQNEEAMEQIDVKTENLKKLVAEKQIEINNIKKDNQEKLNILKQSYCNKLEQQRNENIKLLDQEYQDFQMKKEILANEYKRISEKNLLNEVSKKKELYINQLNDLYINIDNDINQMKEKMIAAEEHEIEEENQMKNQEILQQEKIMNELIHDFELEIVQIQSINDQNYQIFLEDLHKEHVQSINKLKEEFLENYKTKEKEMIDHYQLNFENLKKRLDDIGAPSIKIECGITDSDIHDLVEKKNSLNESIKTYKENLLKEFQNELEKEKSRHQKIISEYDSELKNNKQNYEATIKKIDEEHHLLMDHLKNVHMKLENDLMIIQNYKENPKEPFDVSLIGDEEVLKLKTTIENLKMELKRQRQIAKIEKDSNLSKNLKNIDDEIEKQKHETFQYQDRLKQDEKMMTQTFQSKANILNSLPKKIKELKSISYNKFNDNFLEAQKQIETKIDDFEISLQNLKAKIVSLDFFLHENEDRERSKYELILQEESSTLAKNILNLSQENKTRLKELEKQKQEIENSKNEIESKYNSRPMRKEDQETIEKLEKMLNLKINQLSMKMKDLNQSRSILVHQENEYNSHFGVSPHIAILKTNKNSNSKKREMNQQLPPLLF